jgi:cystathionine beta-lyase family protein involved in aluminum resistance
MKLLQLFKNTVRALDKNSPWPLCYPFLMTKNEKRLFDRKLKEAKHYLEFGLGGSTLRALQHSNVHVYAVESSLDWISYMRQYRFLRRFENNRLTIHHVDIGPTGNFGFPASDQGQDCFADYSSSIYKIIDHKKIDLAIIDGRFRVACVLKLILTCHDNEKLDILFDDFWHRERYHPVLKYLDTKEKADSMGLFTIKKDLDLQQVNEDYQAYKLNPA